ncbi:MAG: HEPN domain-containing protein [Candidatus Bathycorpusculaceae bacterium]
MSSEFQQLLVERKLFRARISRVMILNEIEAAQNDLQDAQDSLGRKKFKWAIIQGYYSMFHSARALLYHRGFRERSHYALLVALRELFGNDLGKSLISRFEEGMELRQEADYGLKFSETGAIETVKGAEELLKRVQELLKIGQI